MSLPEWQVRTRANPPWPVSTALLDLPNEPVLYNGIWDEEPIRSLYTPTFDGDEIEGYVVRLALPVPDEGKEHTFIHRAIDNAFRYFRDVRGWTVTAIGRFQLGFDFSKSLAKVGISGRSPGVVGDDAVCPFSTLDL